MAGVFSVSCFLFSPKHAFSKLHGRGELGPFFGVPRARGA